MTRSDAVRLMMAYINLHCCKTEDAFSGDFLMTPEEAEGLMKFIETKLEMAPPMNKEKSFTMLESGELTYEVREWEPEEKVGMEMVSNFFGERCPDCHSMTFMVARDMAGTRHCVVCHKRWVLK